MPWCNPIPFGKGVSHHIAMDFKYATLSFPFMGYTVNDYHFHALLHTEINSINVVFGCERFFKRQYIITAQLGIQIGRMVFSVNNGNFRPVVAQTKGNQKRAVCIPRP